MCLNWAIKLTIDVLLCALARSMVYPVLQGDTRVAAQAVYRET
jgi:hypothetical protein